MSQFLFFLKVVGDCNTYRNVDKYGNWCCSLQESWDTNPQPPRVSYPENLDSAPMGKSDTNQFFADPHFFNLPRQPLPPPVYAPVQMQPFSVGGHGYSNNLPQAPEVTQFRPGLQQFPETKGPKKLHIVLYLNPWPHPSYGFLAMVCQMLFARTNLVSAKLSFDGF